MKTTSLEPDSIFVRYHYNEGAPLDIWFLHGFGESSLCFREAFDSPLTERYNLYALDFHGFGATPPDLEQATVDGQVGAVIEAIDPARNIVLVGHSMAGLQATRIAQRLPENVKLVVNIDGAILSSISEKIYKEVAESSEEKYKPQLCSEVYELAKANTAFQRYYASLQFADSASLHSLGKDMFRITSQSKIEEEFKSLQVPVHAFCAKAGRKEHKAFLRENNVPITEFENSGHWLMIDEPEKCYSKINELCDQVVRNASN